MNSKRWAEIHGPCGSRGRRPVGSSRHQQARRVHILASCALAGVFQLAATVAVLGEPRDGVLIGTFDRNSEMEQIDNREGSSREGASGPSRHGAQATDSRSNSAIESSPLGPAVIDGWTTRNDAQTPDRGDLGGVANEAHAALASGNITLAQKLFEQIVATEPKSPEAQDARRQLGDIYRGVFDETAAQARADAHPAALATPQPKVGEGFATGDGARRGDTTDGNFKRAADPAADVVTQQPWRPRARRSHRFEALLRADVGDRIFFGSGSSSIGSRARAVLENQAQWLTRYPELYVVVEGHADEPGNDAQNEALAMARAQAARERLVVAGVGPDRIDLETRGRRDRAATCEQATCQSQNRRVVTRLMVVLPSAPGNRSSTGQDPGDGRRIASDADRQQTRLNTQPQR